MAKTDDGTFWINDIKFDIPPQAIKVRRNSVVNYWQTLRTNASIKLPSGFSNVDISVSITLQTSNANDMRRLRDLVSQVRVTPFCWVDNAYLRSVMLAGTSKQAMMLALKQMEIADMLTGVRDTDLLNITLNFAWFNYFPFMKNIQFKQNIFVPKAVDTPDESRAWKLLYTSEQDKGKYLSDDQIQTANTVGMSDDVIFDLTQFMFVEARRYAQTKKDIGALKFLVNSLRDGSFPPTPDASELPGGISQDLYNEMANRAGSTDAVERVLDEAFGHTTSMDHSLKAADVRAEVEALLSKKEQWVESYGTIAEVGDFTVATVEIPGKGNSTIELKGEMLSTSDEVGNEQSVGENDMILMQQPIKLNLRAMRIYPTLISISFENVLASIPVIGHAYPTYQHIGSTDAAVTISMTTDSIAGVQSLSAFYTVAEEQIRKLRQVPQHKKNIRVDNSLLKLCGLHSFVFEDVTFETVPGQPGVSNMTISMVSNPLDRDDQEKFLPGQSFTSTGDIRREILRTLDKYVNFHKEEINVWVQTFQSNSQYLPPKGTQVNHLKIGHYPAALAYKERDPSFLTQFWQSVTGGSNEIQSIYSLNWEADARQQAFRTVVTQYAMILNEMFRSSFVDRILSSEFVTTNLLGTHDAARLFALTDDDVLGISRLQRDIYTALQVLQNKNKFIDTEGHDKWFDFISADRQQVLVEAAKAGGAKDEEVSDYVKSFKKSYKETTNLLHAKILQYWIKRRDSGALSPEDQEEYNKVVNDYEGFSLKSQKEVLEEFATAKFNDYRRKMINFTDTLMRSSAFMLDEFKDIREKMGKDLGVEPGTAAYPDFPMSIVAKKFSVENKELAQKLEDELWTKDLKLYNVGLAAIIKPDFYFYSPSIDKVGDVIPAEAMNRALESVTEVIDKQRVESEDSWMAKVYETRVLGGDRDKMVKQRLVDCKQKYAPRQGGNEKSLYDSKLEAATDDKVKDGLKKMKEKEERLKQNGEHFHYLDFEGAKVKPFLTSDKAGGGLELPVINDKVSQGLYASDRSGRLTPSEYGHSITHNFDDPLGISPAPPSDSSPPQPYDPNKDPEFGWPVAGKPNSGFRITSGFGPRTHPKTGEEGKMHYGLDIALSAATIEQARQKTSQTTVHPVAPGEIIRMNTTKWTPVRHTSKAIMAGGHAEAILTEREDDGFHGSSGNYMVIKHANGWYSKYMHMQWDENFQYWADRKSGRTVGVSSPGANGNVNLFVNTDSVLGKIGNTGIGTGPHLHFEIHKDDAGQADKSKTAVDPRTVIDAGAFTSPGPNPVWNPNAESLFTKSVEQFEKDMQGPQGYSMMRAYPTFKLYFIESDMEERKRFAFDDFFSYSSVIDIQVVRNRKIAADLAVITLTNVSGKLTNRKFRGQGNDMLARRNEQGELTKENPGNAELTNTVSENPIYSLMLQPGTEMQLRLGYASNPQDLERVLNGMVTDVQFTEDEDVVTIVCQSYGFEMTQRIQSKTKDFGGWFSESGETGILLEELMASPELVHFGRWEMGDPEDPNTVRSLLKNQFKLQPSPADDNIFAPDHHGIFSWLGSNMYRMYRTTIWDVFMEMRLRHPGYEAYAVPYDGLYGARCTMFFGCPDQLYFARDPTQKENESIKELAQTIIDTRTDLDKIVDESIPNSKVPVYLGDLVGAEVSQTVEEAALQDILCKRELQNHAKAQGYIRPFRNYHVLTSTMHIIKNQITSTSWNTFNMVTLRYDDNDPDIDEDLGQVVIDDERMMTVKCDEGLPDNEVREMFAEFPNCKGDDLARRYCLSLLRDSLKEGYKGTITIIGNPRIKPHDICYIFDEYNDMFGPIEVEQVVHRFSQDTGFVTEITPDMCIHVNQMSTLKTSHAMGLIAEEVMHKIGMESLASVIGKHNSVRDGLLQQDGTTSSSESLGPVAGAATEAGIVGGGIGGAVVAAQVGLIGKAASMAAAGITFSPIGAAFFAASVPIGIFAFNQYLTRTSMAHPIRYTPLTLQGKAMIGGLPSKYIDGSFGASVKRWFKKSAKSVPLYIDDMYDKIIAGKWVRPSGTPRTLGEYILNGIVR